MAVQITRAHLTISFQNSAQNEEILSRERYESMADAIESLKKRGVPISEDQVKEFESNNETHFSWKEFVNFGMNAYSASVCYDVRNIN